MSSSSASSARSASPEAGATTSPYGGSPMAAAPPTARRAPTAKQKPAPRAPRAARNPGRARAAAKNPAKPVPDRKPPGPGAKAPADRALKRPRGPSAPWEAPLGPRASSSQHRRFPSGAGSGRLALIRCSAFPGRLAQLGERRLDKAEVTGSSPVSPMRSKSTCQRAFCWLHGSSAGRQFCPLAHIWRTPCLHPGLRTTPSEMHQGAVTGAPG